MRKKIDSIIEQCEKDHELVNFERKYYYNLAIGLARA